jgi:hypothetical protein
VRSPCAGVAGGGDLPVRDRHYARTVLTRYVRGAEVSTFDACFDPVPTTSRSPNDRRRRQRSVGVAVTLPFRERSVTSAPPGTAAMGGEVVGSTATDGGWR